MLSSEPLNFFEYRLGGISGLDRFCHLLSFSGISVMDSGTHFTFADTKAGLQRYMILQRLML